MKSVSATEARNNLNAILDDAQGGPIVIRRQDLHVAVVMSMADYERLRSRNVRAFLDLRTTIAEQAAASGLTKKGLTDLLATDDA